MFITKAKLAAKDAKIEELKKTIKNNRATYKRELESYEIERMENAAKLRKANAELSILKEDKKEAREVLKAKIEAEDLASALSKTKELQDAREKSLNKRAENIDSEEEANYVKGYADGISDGLRKAHEITAEDRNNLSKIAMVSAASHTTVEAMKEVNSEFRLTEGSTNKKAK